MNDKGRVMQRCMTLPNGRRRRGRGWSVVHNRYVYKAPTNFPPQERDVRGGVVVQWERVWRRHDLVQDPSGDPCLSARPAITLQARSTSITPFPLLRPPRPHLVSTSCLAAHPSISDIQLCNSRAEGAVAAFDSRRTRYQVIC